MTETTIEPHAATNVRAEAFQPIASYALL